MFFEELGWCFSSGFLLVCDIPNSGFNRILGQNGAVKLDWRKRKLLNWLSEKEDIEMSYGGNICVLNLLSFSGVLADHHLSSEWRRSDGRSAAKGFELGVDDLSIIIHLKSQNRTLRWFLSLPRSWVSWHHRKLERQPCQFRRWPCSCRASRCFEDCWNDREPEKSLPSCVS